MGCYWSNCRGDIYIRNDGENYGLLAETYYVYFIKYWLTTDTKQNANIMVISTAIDSRSPWCIARGGLSFHYF